MTTKTIYNAITSTVKEEGLVVLPSRKYEQLITRLVQQKKTIAELLEQIAIDNIIAEGNTELKEGKTIIASSSKEALKQCHAEFSK